MIIQCPPDSYKVPSNNYWLNNVSLVTSSVDFCGMTLCEHKVTFLIGVTCLKKRKKKVGDLNVRCHYPKVLDVIWFYSLWLFLGKGASWVEETWKIRKVTNSTRTLMTPIKCNNWERWGLWQGSHNGLFSTITASYCFSGKWLKHRDDYSITRGKQKH